MKCYYEYGAKIYKIKAKKHDKVILYNINFKKHIKISHPEMTIKKIQEILENPDYVYTPSRNSTRYYYEKNFKDGTYRVVINKYKRKNTKVVVTGYKVNNEDEFTIKHIHCVCDKKTHVSYEDIERELENDIDYLYEIFNIAE